MAGTGACQTSVLRKKRDFGWKSPEPFAERGGDFEEAPTVVGGPGVAVERELAVVENQADVAASVLFGEVLYEAVPG